MIPSRHSMRSELLGQYQPVKRKQALGRMEDQIGKKLMLLGQRLILMT